MMNSTSRLRGKHSTIASAGTGIDQAPPSPLTSLRSVRSLILLPLAPGGRSWES
jgi:hypothetical protein